MPQTIERRLSTPRSDYVPFGNMESRNGLQERLEIPLLVRALRLPCGGRVLEVGCGRGVALGPSGRLAALNEIARVLSRLPA